MSEMTPEHLSRLGALHEAAAKECPRLRLMVVDGYPAITGQDDALPLANGDPDLCRVLVDIYNAFPALAAEIGRLRDLDWNYVKCEGCQCLFSSPVGLTDDGEQTCCRNCRDSDGYRAALRAADELAENFPHDSAWDKYRALRNDTPREEPGA